MADFTEITVDPTSDYITSPMPADESVVEVRLRDGTTRRAWFGCNIMDAGDFDFVPVDEGDDEPGAETDSIADQVAAWRPLQ